MPKRHTMGIQQKCDCQPPYGAVWRHISATGKRASHSQQPFDCPHYTRLVKHNAMQRLLQQPHGQCGDQKWGDRVQAKSKCTYGANWGSSVTGWRCKRQRDHHLLKSPTIFQQGQVLVLHHRGRRPNNASMRQLPAIPTLRQTQTTAVNFAHQPLRANKRNNCQACAGLPEG